MAPTAHGMPQLGLLPCATATGDTRPGRQKYGPASRVEAGVLAAAAATLASRAMATATMAT
eukprot:3349114-Prymnesium_polylepis.1